MNIDARRKNKKLIPPVFNIDMLSTLLNKSVHVSNEYVLNRAELSLAINAYKDYHL